MLEFYSVVRLATLLRHASPADSAEHVPARCHVSLAPLVAALLVGGVRDGAREAAEHHRSRRRCRAPPSRRRRRSICPGFRCRIGRAMPTAARARPAPSARMPRAFARTATTAPAGRTGSRSAGRRSSALRSAARCRARRHVELARPRTPRAAAGATARAEAVLLHGWMDVAASFQFLVDAFARDFHVIAPDLRGYGEARGSRRATGSPTTSPTSTRCSTRFAPGERVGCAATASAERRDALRRRASGSRRRADRRSTASAFPRKRRSARPTSSPRGSMRSPIRRRSRRTRASTPSPTGCRRTIRACSRDKAAFLAAHWAARGDDGKVRLRRTRGTSCRSRPSTGSRKSFAVWRRITARTLWVAAEESHIPAWLDRHPEGEAATDSLAGVRQPHGEHSGRDARRRSRTPATCCTTISPKRWRAHRIEAFRPRRSR